MAPIVFSILLFFLESSSTLCLAELPTKGAEHVFLQLPSASRGSSLCAFPSLLPVRMVSQNPFSGKIDLQRKDVIDTNAPAYVISEHSNGVIYFRKHEEDTKKSFAYQCPKYGAALIVKCNSDRYELEGTLYLAGKKYRIQPAAVHRPDTPTLDLYDFFLIVETFASYGLPQEHQREKEVADTDNSPSQETRSSGNQWEVKKDNSLLPESYSPRNKRDTKKDYYIDVLVLLDFSFYKYWYLRVKNDSTNAISQAKEYITHIFNGINNRYTSITTLPYNIHVRPVGFLISQVPEKSPWTETAKEADGTVNADVVLSKLTQYLISVNSSLPENDHVMLFTEYDLYSNDNGFRFNNTAGLAAVGTLCLKDGQSISVVEDHGGFQSESTAAHELGHSMGAKHDGQNNTCSGSDGYIMAGGGHTVTSTTRLNPWHFSSCSIQFFKDYINRLVSERYEDSCLLKRINASEVPLVSGLPGQRTGPDDQCRQIYGEASYLCRGTNFGKPEDVCASMFCRNPDTINRCDLNTAAQGTCCGNGKWCIDGVCVSSSNATCYMSVTCPFGERQGVVFDNRTCSQLESGYCYLQEFRLVCCKMCDQSFRNIQGCEYGDKVLGCTQSSCGNDVYDANCCSTCSYNATSRTTLAPPVVTTTPGTRDILDIDRITLLCLDHAYINKMACSAFLATRGRAYCYNATVEKVCCASCNQRKSSDPACLYGDRDPGCGKIAGKLTPCSKVEQELCCDTCSRLSTTKSPPTTTQPPGKSPTSKSERPMVLSLLMIVVVTVTLVLL